ncbi:MAG: sodium:proton exchanger [Sphingomonas sanxanigenens]|uniref:Sodium:proton exchanger n=1 Tax=Sphingomonas sanxanigenens TaxID=397260 RepID=A0A2W5BYE6_9SPHN|nr:MAG: sodium:proton exchanger [Sphingomonas sanxanigenens]
MALSISTPAFSDALVILGAAGLVIPTFARFRINPVIGFILVGVLAGPMGLGSLVSQAPWLYYFTISDPHSIEGFAELGIVLLLFSIGLELSFQRLWAMRAQVFGVGAAELIGSAVIIAVILITFFGISWTGATGLGLALSLSSTALVLPIVGTAGPVGRLAFAMLLFEDLALVPIIFGLGAIAPNATGGIDALVRTLWMSGIAIVVMLVAGRLLLPRIFGQAARTKSPELFLATSLLVVIVASTVTSATGLSPIVGALLAGILIAETEYHDEVEVTTAPFKGLALGVFLITVGMSIDLRFLIDHAAQMAAAVVGVVIVKSIVTAALLRISGARRGVSIETAVLMSSPSETTLIVLGVATQGGLINPADANFWQVVTAIGLTITPLLARIGRDVSRRVEMKEAPDAEVLPDIHDAPGTVILGFGRVGRLVADMLRNHGKKFVAIEADVDVVAQARREGYPVLFGDVSHSELLDKLNLGRADALVLTMDQPALSVRIVRKVRGWVPGLTIVSRARDTDHAAQLYKAGATDAVPETLEASLQLSETVLVELGVAMGPLIASIHQVRDDLRQTMKESADLDHTPKLARTRLRDLEA